MGKAIRFLVGFTVGVYAGAVVARMLPPEQADRLRRPLSDRLRPIIEEGERAAYQRREELRREFMAAKQLRPSPPGLP
jgi:gas vesicle protein